MTPNQIRTLRSRLGWTTRQMAQYLDVSGAAITHWEMGNASPDTWRAQVLAELKRQVDDMDRKRRSEFAEELAAIAIGAGLIGFLTHLLTRNEKPESS